MRFMTVLFAALALNGCMTKVFVDSHPNVYIDPSFTAEERSQIADAFSTWEQVANGVSFTPYLMDKSKTDGENAVYMYKDAACVQTESKDDPNMLAITIFGEGNAKVCVDTVKVAAISGRSLKTIVAHELGHTLGLIHNQTHGVLMYATTDFESKDGATCTDAIELTKVQPDTHLSESCANAAK